MVNSYTPLIFFVLMIISAVIATIVYFSPDISNIYLYPSLGLLVISAFITVITLFSNYPQSPVNEQKFVKRSTIVIGSDKPERKKYKSLTDKQAEWNRARGFYDPDAEYPIQRKYLRNVRRR